MDELRQQLKQLKQELQTTFEEKEHHHKSMMEASTQTDYPIQSHTITSNISDSSVCASFFSHLCSTPHLFQQVIGLSVQYANDLFQRCEPQIQSTTPAGNQRQKNKQN